MRRVEGLVDRFIYDINQGVLLGDNRTAGEEVSDKDTVAGLLFVFDFLADRFRVGRIDAANVTNVSVETIMQIMGAS